MVASGHEVPARNGRPHWRHDRIVDELEDAGMDPFPGWAEDFEYLQSLRVKADYSRDSVNVESMDIVYDLAERIVQWVNANDPTPR